MEEKIRIENVTKKFGSYAALDGISLNFEKGKIHGIIGRNGSGKTVLFKCICGFLRVDGGAVLVNGKQVGKEIEAPESIGAIIETPGFLPGYSARQNLQFLAGIRGKIGKKEIADGHPVDEYNNEVLCRLTPLQQKEVGIPAFYIRPVVPRLKSSDENEARLSEMAHLEDELYQAEEEAGVPHQKQNIIVHALQKYADWKENRPRHKVDKRIYVLLTVFLGWCGAHRFLEHRWKLGIFYLLVGWTGLGLAFALVDLLIALPIPKDENGMIEI